MVTDDQNGMCYGNGCALLSTPRSQAVKLRSERRLLCMGRSMRSLDQDAPERKIALADPTGETLPSALVVAGRHTAPGAKVASTRKPAHIGSDLGYNLLCRRAGDAWNGVQTLDGLLKRGFRLACLFDGAVEASDGLVQAVDLAQKFGKDKS